MTRQQKGWSLNQITQSLFFSCIMLVSQVHSTPLRIDADSLSATSGIVGGSVVESPIPFLVSLQTDGRHKCGGFLISRRMVLTAAHCVMNDRSTPDPSQWSAAINRKDLAQSFEAERAFDLPVKRIVLHPNYDTKTLGFDIALFELMEPVNEDDDRIWIAPIDVDGSYTRPGTAVVALGWGNSLDTSNGMSFVRDQHLKKVDMLLQDISVCQQYYQALPNADEYQVVPESMQCMAAPGYSGAEGRGTCEGDSGSPVYTVDAQNLPVIVGVVSWGLAGACGIQGDPSVNTDLYKLSPWIQSVLSEMGESLGGKESGTSVAHDVQDNESSPKDDLSSDKNGEGAHHGASVEASQGHSMPIMFSMGLSMLLSLLMLC